MNGAKRRWLFWSVNGGCLGLVLAACSTSENRPARPQSGPEAGGSPVAADDAGRMASGDAPSPPTDARAEDDAVSLGADGPADADADGSEGPAFLAADGGYTAPDKLTCAVETAGEGKYDETTMGLQNDPPEWNLAPGVKAGTLTPSASYASKIYGQHFPYRVYTSANVVKGQPAVFMTFGDGLSEYLGGFHAATVLDNLTATGDVPPTVALFIDPPSDGDRVMTYDPPTDKYSRFLLQEIMPDVIAPTYTISQDPAAWATGGHSASAEQDWTVLWTTDRFHKFLGHNSSFGAAPTYGVDWARTIAAAPKRDLRVSLVVAAVGHDLVDQRGDWTLINEGVAQALAGKGNDYRLIIGPGDHNGPASERDFPTALRWAFRGCKFDK
jgi:enterochelin esterase-like enzyme